MPLQCLYSKLVVSFPLAFFRQVKSRYCCHWNYLLLQQMIIVRVYKKHDIIYGKDMPL